MIAPAADSAATMLGARRLVDDAPASDEPWRFFPLPVTTPAATTSPPPTSSSAIPPAHALPPSPPPLSQLPPPSPSTALASESTLSVDAKGDGN